MSQCVTEPTVTFLHNKNSDQPGHQPRLSLKFYLCTLSIAQDTLFHNVDSEESDQTGWTCDNLGYSVHINKCMLRVIYVLLTAYPIPVNPAIQFHFQYVFIMNRSHSGVVDKLLAFETRVCRFDPRLLYYVGLYFKLWPNLLI